eukprot:CAMPEP_0175075924 /NCGR_PEP_ID=MMETSP0052_2-20121109/22372_1 /TAXON_ID=51329 ORGANISM="Polytomella parva, Strain SAG 63-3" /NCGR_SAMPLE_ID=MMETSP0052_2 /ASSEMBLY_ACC=CAM_ASM_000194 /LENGTH=81 /DNA_ID=CAMNT_0016344867 /DNA_START=30 /DNA_END=272 /DNA_ORIENTATION=+
MKGGKLNKGNEAIKKQRKENNLDVEVVRNKTLNKNGIEVVLNHYQSSDDVFADTSLALLTSQHKTDISESGSISLRGSSEV